MSVNSIVGIPIIKLWRSIFDFDSSQLVAKGINKKIPIIYEATKYGLPHGITFSSSYFLQPDQGTISDASTLLINFENVEPSCTT